MPYNLLYTRSISSDDRVRFTDVPITSPSIMVDVLSLRSPFYRIAGYAYSIVSDGVIDYERGDGYTLPFGKNRLLFPNTVLPYYLEFFPKWGTKQAIISVYTGSPTPPAPPGGWKQMAIGPYQMRLDTSPAGISYRTTPDDEALVVGSEGAVEAIMIEDDVIWRNTLGEYLIRSVNTSYVAYIQSQVEFDAARATVGSIVL